ncbi:MAG TPA: PQQ-binding-like beta-propeller repeat protein, partial [Tepidisphaeraceae bacterium]|nr:PQQ-binding-like beta-propeller repeat protein [Tepidisphaeraceae bacterium]
QAVKALDFSGSPLVVGDNVYVIGRGGKSPTSEDCYVICLDAATGAYKWSSFVASSSGGAYMYGQAANADTLSHLAFSSGRVYCLTNLGAVAAIDAYAGTVLWLNIYPRDNAQDPNQVGGGFRRMAYAGSTTGGTKAWEFNPVIVSEGKVFLLPTDGRKHLLVYDAGSGAELKRIPIDRLEDDAQDGGAPRRGPLTLTSIIGVDGNQVFMTGANYLYAIDWTKYDPARPKTGSMAASEGGCRLWTHEAAREVPGRGFQANLVTGRGFVTADAVFLCTQTNLRWFSRKTGKIQAGYPGRDADGRDRTWDETVEGPGSVLVTGDHVIVASKKCVSVYADMTLARKRLDDDVAANPTSPEPRLRYAEVMFVAGKLDVAMEKLQETVQLLGGLKSMRQGPERDHLFNDCLTFAIKLQKDKRQENIEQTLEMVNALYDLAAAAADGDSQQVNYRVSRAKFNVDYKQEGSYEAAVKLYQEILTSAKLRTVPLADADAGGATQAGLLAEKQIADIKKREPAAYAAFEKEAVDKLVTAGADPAALKLVAESYPNSNAAGKAMAAAAAAYEARGDFRLAAHTFGLVSRKYGEGQDRTRLLEGMARNYLAMPDRTGDRVDTAAGRLAAVVVKNNGRDEKLAKPLKLPDGQMLVDAGVTFGQALKAVQGHRSRVAAAKLPDFKLVPGPTEEVLEKYIKDSQAWIDSNGPIEQKPESPYKAKEAFVPVADRPVVENVEAIVSAPLELRRAHARHDRVVVWANGALAAYPVGQTKAAATSDALGATAPTALAWLDGGAGLAVWTGSDVVMLDGETLSKKWAVNLRGLPRIDVVAGGGATEDTVANANNELDEQMLNGGVAARRAMMLRGRVRFVNGVQVAGPGAVAQPQGPERIVLVKPVSDRVIVATSAGQLFAVSTSTGQVAWHTRVAQSSAVERLLANEDFVVAKVTDSATTQLVAIDTLTGQLVRRLSFPNDSGNVPVNLALAPDGMLVWTQVDRMCGKDLFETRRELTFEVIAGLDDRKPNQPVNVGVDGQPINPIYAGATQFDQLVISEGRVLAVTDSGRYVSAHSLESGKVLDYTNKEGRSEKFRLSTVSSSGTKQAAAPADWAVSLNVVGQMLYVTTRQSGPVAYNLDNPTESWEGAIDVNTAPNLLYQEAMIGQDFFVVLGQPARKGGVAANPGGAGGNPNVPAPAPVPANAPGAGGGNVGVPSTQFRINAYSRAIIKKGTESGRLDHSAPIRDDAGITDWEPVEGGLYYLGGDKKLHFLKGGRADAKADARPDAKADAKPDVKPAEAKP